MVNKRENHKTSCKYEVKLPNGKTLRRNQQALQRLYSIQCSNQNKALETDLDIPQGELNTSDNAVTDYSSDGSETIPYDESDWSSGSSTIPYEESDSGTIQYEESDNEDNMYSVYGQKIKPRKPLDYDEI